VTTAQHSGPKSRAALAALLLAPAMMLAACSGRDTGLSEKVAAAEAAAARAQMAADRAEKAANKVDKPAAVQVEADPEDIADPAPDQDQQNAAAPVDHS